MSGELFYLGPLNVDASSSMATVAGSVSNAFDGNATANVDITLSTFRSLFQYQSDSAEINDAVADDVKFRVVYADAPNAPLGMDIDTYAEVVDRAIDGTASNNNITYDYTRYLALKLFNTHLGVDLFDNEEVLRGDLNASFKTRFNELLLALAARGATDQNDNASNGTHYDTTSPSRIIFNQLLANKPVRFSDISSNEAEVVDGKHWYHMPGEIGDKFFFLINVAAAEDQHDLTGVTTPIPVRAYLISATIVPEPTIFTYSDGTTLRTTASILTGSLYTTGGRSASQLVSVTIGDSVTSLGGHCFAYSGLTSITIPDSVTSLGDYCFAYSGLTSIIVPNSVTTIGAQCFKSCTGLVSATLPINSDFKSLGQDCFAFCSELTAITIPASIETLGLGAVGACPKLASVEFAANSNLTSIGQYCFIQAKIASITIPATVTTLMGGCLEACPLLTSLTFENPSNIISIDASMLSSTPGPITVTFNNTVDYAALNSPVSTYFTETPPANCASPYIFNA
jgi:hypothetical protein